ncbi:MAG: molybdate ABC transporter substrate-binding protein [Egibacteraceae bacterium]
MRIRLLFLLLASVALAACGGQAGQQAADGATEDLSGTVNVFAAASLTEAFEEIEAAFTEAHPGVDITLNFGPSSGLATQITEGAPADVFASANQTQMTVVTDAGLAQGEPRVFAQNFLEIAVEPGNPLGITGLADLARPDVTLVLADEGVPAGDFAREALANAGVEVTPASLEVDVRAVLAKVQLGEADAGIVYVTDVLAAGDEVEGVAIPPERNIAASYPIAPLTSASNPEAAQAFVDFVLSPEGQEILVGHGFQKP